MKFITGGKDPSRGIWFDMDGTISSLYTVDDWCHRITHDDATPYLEASPMVDTQNLARLLDDARASGITCGVVSWSAKGVSKRFDEKVRDAKMEWLKRHGLKFDAVHVLAYGTPKESVASGILIDDDERVGTRWQETRGNVWYLPKMMETAFLDVLAA